MTSLMELPTVSTCSVDGCSYNHDHNCGAVAITVGQAACVTFIPLTMKGGVEQATSHVGACQRADCLHNSDLECTADSVQIGSSADVADCLTYTPAR